MPYWIEEKRGWFIVRDLSHKQIGKYLTEKSAKAAIADMAAIEVENVPAGTTGWSKAARARAMSSTVRVDNALGRGIVSGDGYTMYEGADGSGRFNTQIWDES